MVRFKLTANKDFGFGPKKVFKGMSVEIECINRKAIDTSIVTDAVRNQLGINIIAQSHYFDIERL
jgi:hypothetical protein